MKKLSHLIVATLATGLVFGVTTPTSVQAADQVKVLATKKVKKTAYHANSGNVYSTEKLKHVTYHLVKLQETTWYASKQATILKSDKKISYTFIQAGKKHGWVYTKDLIKGKPAKYSRIYSDSAAFRHAIRHSSTKTSKNADFLLTSDYATSSYSEISQQLLKLFGPTNKRPYAKETVTSDRQDKLAMHKVYQIFRKSFSRAQNNRLSKLDSHLTHTKVTKRNKANVAKNIDQFSRAMAKEVQTLYLN